MIKKEKPIIDRQFLLRKYSGKGGWTYAEIEEIPAKYKKAFGYVRVRGTIDGFEIKAFHLMPMKNGNMFLPVRAEIRKKIKKEEGQFVHVILFRDDSPTEVPQELKDCLEQDPDALAFFNNISLGEQQAFVNWVYSAKNDETKVERIANMLDKLSRGVTLNTMRKD